MGVWGNEDYVTLNGGSEYANMVADLRLVAPSSPKGPWTMKIHDPGELGVNLQARIDEQIRIEEARTEAEAEAKAREAKEQQRRQAEQQEQALISWLMIFKMVYQTRTKAGQTPLSIERLPPISRDEALQLLALFRKQNIGAEFKGLSKASDTTVFNSLNLLDPLGFRASLDKFLETKYPPEEWKWFDKIEMSQQEPNGQRLLELLNKAGDLKRDTPKAAPDSTCISIARGKSAIGLVEINALLTSYAEANKSSLRIQPNYTDGGGQLYACQPGCT